MDDQVDLSKLLADHRKTEEIVRKTAMEVIRATGRLAGVREANKLLIEIGAAQTSRKAMRQLETMADDYLRMMQTQHDEAIEKLKSFGSKY